MNEEQEKKKDFFDRISFRIPMRYLFCAVWGLSTIVTWLITRDFGKAMLALIYTPVVCFGLFLLYFMLSLYGLALLLPLYKEIISIIPQKYRLVKWKWWIIIPLWVALPLYTLIVRGDVLFSLITLAALPFFIFLFLPLLVLSLMLVFGLLCSLFFRACEVKNPILKIFAIIGALIIIVFIVLGIAASFTDRGSYDYDQYDRRDPTYYR